MERRDFLRAAGAAALGAAALPPRDMPAYGHSPGEGARAHLAPLGVQLYTMRSVMPRDPEGTLARIAQIGYQTVEWWGEYGRTPEQIRALLDRNHLRSPSGHYGLEALEGDAVDATLRAARTLGHHYLVVASTPPETQTSLDGWRRVADRFNVAAERIHREGFQFAYHNHDAEFHELEGRVPYDVLCEATDPHLVQLEVDLYWIITGGGDPIALFRRWPGRVPMVHVKDRTADGRMVDVGAGAIDWRGIFAHRREAGIRYYFVEHDDPPDPFASIQASYAYLSRLDV